MGIYPSPKYGLNPSMSLCFYCHKEKNEIVIPGRLRSKDGTDTDVEAPRTAVWNKEPCDECKAWMEKGVIVISVRDGETDYNNPYRTGHWCVVTDSAIESLRSMVTDKTLIDRVLAQRVCFLEDTAWKDLGFPTEPTTEN